jgi:hypothetical protein
MMNGLIGTLILALPTFVVFTKSCPQGLLPQYCLKVHRSGYVPLFLFAIGAYVPDHLTQVACVRVEGSRSNLLRTVQMLQGRYSCCVSNGFLVDEASEVMPSIVPESIFRSPKVALHQGRVTCLKTFRINAMSRVNRMIRLALQKFR